MRKKRRKLAEPKPEVKKHPPDWLPYKLVTKQVPCSLRVPASSSADAVIRCLQALKEHHAKNYILQEWRVLSQSKSAVVFECLFLAPDGWQLP